MEFKQLIRQSCIREVISNWKAVEKGLEGRIFAMDFRTTNVPILQKEYNIAAPHPQPQIHIPWFQFFAVNWGPEAHDPPSDVLPEGQRSPNATSQCLCHSLHFLSPHRTLSERGSMDQ